jgi:hypothetical protein
LPISHFAEDSFVRTSFFSLWRKNNNPLDADNRPSSQSDSLWRCLISQLGYPKDSPMIVTPLQGVLVSDVMEDRARLAVMIASLGSSILLPVLLTTT